MKWKALSMALLDSNHSNHFWKKIHFYNKKSSPLPFCSFIYSKRLFVQKYNRKVLYCDDIYKGSRISIKCSTEFSYKSGYNHSYNGSCRFTELVFSKLGRVLKKRVSIFKNPVNRIRVFKNAKYESKKDVFCQNFWKM